MSSLKTKYRVCLHPDKISLLTKLEDETKFFVDSCKDCKPLFESVGFRDVIQ